MNRNAFVNWVKRFFFAGSLLLVLAVYWPGLSGSWLLDDYPNIVENTDVQPDRLDLPSLTAAALSSTASDLKRPVASLTFALNYWAFGLSPFWMKLTNVLIHMLNGVLVYFLSRRLLDTLATGVADNAPLHTVLSRVDAGVEAAQHRQFSAALIATGWLLLPINLTAVLYVVQRMESLANLFVLIGLLGYVGGRRRMMGEFGKSGSSSAAAGLLLCVLSLTVPTVVGVLAKESAILLPLYALLIEWTLFRAWAVSRTNQRDIEAMLSRKSDLRIWLLFGVVLLLPLLIGVSRLLPRLFDSNAWLARDFSMRTRLLSEARVILDYIDWTLLPNTHALKFYYDDFVISSGWLSPGTTLASAVGIAALLALAIVLRGTRPLVALGILLFFAAHLLTGTIYPLELVYEHRNYFASFGLLLALIPLLAAPGSAAREGASAAPSHMAYPIPLLRHAFLGILLVLWLTQTALGAYTWGDPLRLAQELAVRSPDSLRAQYDLGRTYSAYSQYDPGSRFTQLAMVTLERAAQLPSDSILPEQALIYMDAVMHLPAKVAWWDSLIAKLRRHPPTAQDTGALRTLSICAIKHRCELPQDRMSEAFHAALDHPNPSAQLQARYGDYAWNVLGDKILGEQLLEAAIKSDPKEADYRVALVHMLVAQGRSAEARQAILEIVPLNVGGRLDAVLQKLRQLPGMS